MPSEQQKAVQRAYSMVRALERKRRSRIFLFVESGDDHICHPLRNLLYNKANIFRNIDKLEVLIHSGGGHAEYAYQIATLFRRHCKQLNVIIPAFAKSAATLMCLAADAVYMGERAELGPLDVQVTDPFEKGLESFSPIDEFKSMEFLREYAIELLDYYAFALVERTHMSVKEAFQAAMPTVANTMSPLYAKVDPSKIGSYRRSLAVAEEYAKRLLEGRGIPDSNKLAEKLVWKYPSHDFVINRDEARAIGLPVVPLDVKQDEAFVEIIRSLSKGGESVYAFAEADEKKRKTAKRRSASKKSAPATPAKLKAA